MALSAAIAIVTLAVTIAVAVLPKAPPDSQSHATGTGRSATIAADLAGYITCRDPDTVHDDMSFYDRMSGLNCRDDDGNVTVIRVYDHAESVPVVLRDWQPLITQSRPLVTGPRWFATGPRHALEELAASVADASQVTTAVPSSVDKQVSSEQMVETNCVIFTTGAIKVKALEPQEYPKQIVELDKIYPGIHNFVDTEVTPGDAQTYSGLEAKKDSFRSEAFLSKFGPAVKLFCKIPYGQ